MTVVRRLFRRLRTAWERKPSALLEGCKDYACLNIPYFGSMVGVTRTGLLGGAELLPREGGRTKMQEKGEGAPATFDR